MTTQGFGQITVRLEISSTYVGDFENPRTILVAKPDKIEEKVLAWVRKQSAAAIQRHEDFLAAKAEERANGHSSTLSPWRPRYDSRLIVPSNYRGD